MMLDRKILVVSDNIELSIFVKSLLSRPEMDINFKLCHYRNNSKSLEFLEIESFPIDFSKKDVIDWIVGEFDTVINVHGKQIFPSQLTDQVRCVNIHPGLNPYNRGWYPQVFSIINGLPTGVTIHLMDRRIDGGPVLFQKQVEIYDYDTSWDIYQRIIETEKKLLESRFSEIIDPSILGIEMKEAGNYNSQSDFEALKDLNLDEIGTLREHLNLLRALSHNGFRNAKFRDSKGNLVTCSISLNVISEET